MAVCSSIGDDEIVEVCPTVSLVEQRWVDQIDVARAFGRSERSVDREAKKQGDLLTWRRGKVLRDYIHGKKVLAIATEFEVARSA